MGGWGGGGGVTGKQEGGSIKCCVGQGTGKSYGERNFKTVKMTDKKKDRSTGETEGGLH